MSRGFLQSPRCTWTPVPLRSKPALSSLEKAINQSSPAKVGLQTGNHLAFFFAKLPAMFFHTFQGQLWYLIHFFYTNKSNFPFHLFKKRQSQCNVRMCCCLVCVMRAISSPAVVTYAVVYILLFLQIT